MPTLNGDSAKVAIIGAIGLLVVLIIASTFIIVSGNPIPTEFSGLLTLLAGFLVGTRVLTDSAVAQSKTKTESKKEDTSATKTPRT